MKYIISIFIFFQFCGATAQDLADYQWKNRLLIIMTDTEKNKLYQSQLNDVRTAASGMEERKFIVIRLTPNYQITGINSEVKHKARLDYNDLKEKAESFEILLVGLDGSIKLRKRSLLTHQELFTIVDRMPMRRSEIEKN